MSAAELITKDPSVRFIRQPIPVVGELRVVWRISLVIVILYICGHGREKRMSLKKLHVIAWGCKTSRTNAQVAAQLDAGQVAGGPFVGVDPTLNAAIDFAVAENLVLYLQNGRISLSSEGAALAKELMTGDVLMSEKSFASGLKSLATEQAITRLYARARQ